MERVKGRGEKKKTGREHQERKKEKVKDIAAESTRE